MLLNALLQLPIVLTELMLRRVVLRMSVVMVITTELVRALVLLRVVPLIPVAMLTMILRVTLIMLNVAQLIPAPGHNDAAEGNEMLRAMMLMALMLLRALLLIPIVLVTIVPDSTGDLRRMLALLLSLLVLPVVLLAVAVGYRCTCTDSPERPRRPRSRPRQLTSEFSGQCVRRRARWGNQAKPQFEQS